MKIDTPKYLVLQMEGVLVNFPEHHILPVTLQTTNLCNCFSIVIYSAEKGVAYLNHMYPNDLREDVCRDYHDHLMGIITEYKLNDKNTFVAMIGAHDDSLPSNIIPEENEHEPCERYGAESFMNVLKDLFPSMYCDLGGKPCVQRSIELTPHGLKVLTQKYGDDSVQLKFDEIRLEANQLWFRREVNAFTFYFRGQKIKTESGSPMQMYNTLLRDYNAIHLLNMKNENTVLDRSRQLGLQSIDLDLLVGSTPSKFWPLFNPRNKEITFSQIAFYCMLSQPDFFRWLLNYLSVEKVMQLSFKKMNLFCYAKVRSALTHNELTVDDLLSDKPSEKTQALCSYSRKVHRGFVDIPEVGRPRIFNQV